YTSRVGGLCWGRWWRRWVSSAGGGDGLERRGEVLYVVAGKKVGGSTETNALVKLCFKTAAGKDVVCTRYFRLTEKGSKMEYKVIENVLQTINHHTRKDNPLPTSRLPEAFLSIMGISPHHTPGDDMYPTFLLDDGPDPKLAETPSVFNSELRNAASPRREVTGEENVGAGNSAFDLVFLKVRTRKRIFRSIGRGSVRSWVSLCRHARCTSSMGSPSRVFTPEWNVPGDTLLTVPEVCADFLDNITPPGRDVYLEQLSSADLLRELSVTTAQHATATAHLRSRFERQILEAKVKTETVRSQSLVEENASLSAQLQKSQQRYNVRECELQLALGSLRECEQMISKEISEIYETATAKVSAQDNRLHRMNMEFDFELYPHFLSAIAERRWLIGSGLRLAVNNVLESSSVREAFAGAVRAAGAKGKRRGLIDGFNHCAASGELTALPGYDPKAIEKFSAPMGKLKNLDLSFISDLECLKDHPITSVMSSLALLRSLGGGSSFESDLESQLSVAKFVEGSSYESRHTAESERSLLDVLDAHAERVALKKSFKGGGPVRGVGAAHQTRPKGVLIGTSTIYPAYESFLARVAKGVQDTATPPSVIQAIYGEHGKIDADVKIGSKSCWLNIVHEAKALAHKGIDLRDFMHIKLRNGENTRFWEDSCIEGDLLRNCFPQMYALESCKRITVRTKLLQPSLKCSFRRKQRGGVVLDVGESEGFYCIIGQKTDDDKLIPEVGSKTRWVKYVQIKVNVNAWKVKFDVLPTRFNLSRRGIHIDSIMCVICDKEVETSWHLFFSCCMVHQMIRLIIRWWDVPHEEFDNYDDWRNWIVNLRLPSKSKLMLEGVFYVMWLCLQSIRNKMIFEDKIPMKAVFFDDVMTKSYNWCRYRFAVIIVSSLAQGVRVIVVILSTRSRGDSSVIYIMRSRSDSVTIYTMSHGDSSVTIGMKIWGDSVIINTRSRSVTQGRS
nr:RNA-directed DNA polymerase, eukaryota [Tanacetum cinerariifolium]